MAATVSVSKGCFVFNKNKFTKRRTAKNTVKQDILCNDLWYLAYKEAWTWVEEKFETLHQETFSSVLKDLVSFVNTSYENENVEREISTVPTAALLTGINMPDHGAIFSTLCDLLHEHVSPYVATLHAQKCKTIRHAVEQMTSQFMNTLTSDEEEGFSDESDNDKPIKVKKSQCNMLVLESWYQEHNQTNVITSRNNNEKTESIELKQGLFSSTSPNRKHKFNETIQDEKAENIRRSPRKQFNCIRKDTENKEDDLPHHVRIMEAETNFNARTSELQKVCNGMIRLNGEAKLHQRTPTKQTLSVKKEDADSPRLRRTPRKLSLDDIDGFGSPKLSSNELLPYAEKKKLNNCHAAVNCLTGKFNEGNLLQRTRTRDRRVEELQKNELGSQVRRSPRSPKPIARFIEESSGDSDCSTSSSYKRRKIPRDQRVKELQKTELEGQVRKSLRSPKPIPSFVEESGEDSDSSTSSSYKRRIILRNRRVKELQKTELEDKVRRSPRSPKPIPSFVEEDSSSEDSDSSTSSSYKRRNVSRDQRVKELQKTELEGRVRKSLRSPKPIARFTEESSGDSDCPTSSSSKRRKIVTKKKYSRSGESPLKVSQTENLNKVNNIYMTPSKSKNRVCDKEYRRSPKVLLKRIDQTYEIIKSLSKDRFAEEDNKETPRKVARLIEELRDEKSPSAEHWICEVDLNALAAERKIPKLVLRQLHELKAKVSPQKSPVKEVKNEDQRTPRKMPQTPIKNSKDAEIEEDQKRVIPTDKQNFSSTDLSQGRDNKCSQRKKLIVIIPEFEKFPSKVLQDFILILRSSIPALPIVLIMGIATSVAAVHRSLPYRMSACLSIKPFQSPPSVQLLNSVLEQILFSPEFPFRLGNKTFCFLMDAFLYYDLSVKGFVQAIKFCMMEHFCGQNWKQLCCKQNSLSKKNTLSSEDLSALRNLPSFLQYMTNLEDEIKNKLMNSDEYFYKTVLKLLKHLQSKVHLFHIGLKCLNILVADLPKKPLGIHVRELYGMAASSPITRTPEYKECIQILRLLSRDELVMKLKKIICFLDENREESHISSLAEKVSDYKKKIQEAGMVVVSPQHSPKKMLVVEGKISRHAFKEKLMQLSKKDQHQSPYEKRREEFLEYLSSQVFPVLLKPLVAFPLVEVMMFDNVASVRTHIVGAPRAAIHTALNDPHFYLECKCCMQTEKDSILASMPDLCILYKLYRECGRLINLYDWLQAFSAIVDPQKEEDEKQHEVKPQVQARFTRAVAELQFMGFVKTSSRKVDHVTKLYFDGGF